MARKIERIVIHCSDSPNGRTLFTGKPGEPGFTPPVREIDRWHRERGFSRLPNWRALQNPELSSIGYHFVVYTRGEVATGRHVDEVGAHVQGYNATSLGICLVGRDAFTSAQWDSLRQLVDGLLKRYLGSRVVAHHDLNPAKTCPNFDVAAWIKGGMQPIASQIFLDPIQGEIA